MELKKRICAVLKKADLFRSPVKLFFEQQEYSSPIGGLFSLVVSALIVSIFLPTFQTFFSFQNYSVQISQFNVSPEPLTTLTSETFSLAVMLYGYNGTKKSHDVYFTESEVLIDQRGVQISNRTTRHLGIPCNTSLWADVYGNKVASALKLYEQQNGMLICNPPEFNMSLQGRYSTNMTAFLVSIERCRSKDCLTDQQILDEKVSFFYPQVIFPQTTFDYYSKNPIQLSLQEEFWYYSKASPLTRKAYEVLLSDVIIDDSNADIWPAAIPFFHNASNNRRGFLVDMLYQTDELINDDVLAFWRFRKSSKTIVASRSIDKVDDLISYIGGCLGVMLVIGEVLRAYNEKLMLLHLGDNIKFSPEGKAEPPLYKTFGFMNFLELSVNTLLGRRIQSPQQLNYIQKARFLVEHSEKQLSVNRLCRRLRKCEILLECLAGENSLHLVAMHSENAVELHKEEELAKLLEDSFREQCRERHVEQRIPMHRFQNVKCAVRNELFKRKMLPTILTGINKVQSQERLDDHETFSHIVKELCGIPLT